MTPRNAFVGPRPVPSDRRLYGRDRELLALCNRLMAERMILLYSPSGAGKSSLLVAAGGLIARMEEEGFVPLPRVPIRVSHAAEVACRTGVNRYLLSTLLALEGARPEPVREGAEALAARIAAAGVPLPNGFLGDHLAALLPQTAGEETVQPLLAFDQFEEVVTLDPTDGAAKREFFGQLGHALRNPDRWAVFAMREDHVPLLDPYLPALPTRLAATFRLDFLNPTAAAEAARKPPAEAEYGVTFEGDAIDKLVDDLVQVNVQNPLTAESERRNGPSVEPLFLQVVCERLWDVCKPPPGGRIGLADLPRLTDRHADDLHGVDAALAGYYSNAIKEVSEQLPADDRVTERKLRRWFDRALISDKGLRLPVLFGTEAAYGLNPRAVLALANRYLIRSEPRHGGIYYELAHDRLADPIRKNNQAWRAAELTDFQRRAELWQESGGRSELLMEGEALLEAEGQNAREAWDESGTDAAFLAACRRASLERAERAAHRRNRRVLWGIAIAAILVIAVGSVRSYRARQQKDQLMGISQAHTEYLAAWRFLNTHRASGHAAEALKLFHSHDRSKAPPELFDRVLPQALANRSQRVFGLQTESGEQNMERDHHAAAVIEMLYAEVDGGRLVSRDTNGLVLMWDKPTGPPPERPGRAVGSVQRMALTPGERYLLVGHTYGWVCRWELEDWSMEKRFRSFEPAEQVPVTSLRVDPHAELGIAVAGYGDGMVRVLDWNLPDGPALRSQVVAGKRAVAAALYSSQSGKVVTDLRDGKIKFWKPVKGVGPPELTGMVEVPMNVCKTAIGPSGSVVAVGTEEGVVSAYHAEDLRPLAPPITRDPNRGGSDPQKSQQITMLAVGPASDEGIPVLIGSDISVPMLYRIPLTTGGMAEAVAVGPLRAVKSEARPMVATFAADGSCVAIGTGDGAINVWRLDNPARPAFTLKTTGAVTAILLHTDRAARRWLFTGHGDGTIRRWELREGTVSTEECKELGNGFESRTETEIDLFIRRYLAK